MDNAKENKQGLALSGNEESETSRDTKAKQNVSLESEKKQSRLAQVLHNLGDVVDGKKSLKEVINELMAQHKEEREQLFAQARDLFDNFKKTVKESYQDRTMANKYDMSKALAHTSSDGTRQYIGVKPKPTLAQEIKNSTVELLNKMSSGAQKVANFAKDTADLVAGKITPEQFEEKHPTKSPKELLSNISKEASKAREKAWDTTKIGRGLNSFNDGVKATLDRLRGLNKERKVVKPITSNGRDQYQSNRTPSLDR